MNHELKLAAILGALPTTKMEKLSSEFEGMSIEELNELTAVEGSSFLDDAAREIASREKIAMADNWGRELARMEKTSAIPGAGMMGAAKTMGKNIMGAGGGTMKGMLGRGMAATQQVRGSTMAGMGAAGGAALGAAKGLVAPGTNQATGQQNSRLGAMAGGAAKGAVLGGGAAMAVRGGVRAAGSMGNTGGMLGGAKGAIGQATRNTMQTGLNEMRQAGPLTEGASKFLAKGDKTRAGMGVLAGKSQRGALATSAQNVASNPRHGQNYVPGTSNTSAPAAGTKSQVQSANANYAMQGAAPGEFPARGPRVMGKARNSNSPPVDYTRMPNR